MEEKKTIYTEQDHIILNKENIDAYLSKFMKIVYLGNIFRI